jgi:transcriptional regulator with XRE-family HTH domain
MAKKKIKSLNLLVSQAIRRLRNDMGVSQEELANRCNLDRTYISAVERGRRNITIGSLSRIVVSLELTEQSFLQELINQIDISEGDSDE